jgi:hypothetical protein
MVIHSRAQVDVLLRERLTADPQFAQRLMDDPRGALSDLVGTPIPAHVSVVVHEESLTSVHVVLPARPVQVELSEDDLELIAGGANSVNSCNPTFPPCWDR